MPKKAKIDGPYDWDWMIVATEVFSYSDEELNDIAKTLPRPLEKHEFEELNRIASYVHIYLSQSKKGPPNSVVELKVNSINKTVQKIVFGDSEIKKYAYDLGNQLMVYVYGYIPSVISRNLDLSDEKTEEVIRILRRIIENKTSEVEVLALKDIINDGFKYFQHLQEDLEGSFEYRVRKLHEFLNGTLVSDNDRQLILQAIRADVSDRTLPDKMLTNKNTLETYIRSHHGMKVNPVKAFLETFQHQLEINHTLKTYKSPLKEKKRKQTPIFQRYFIDLNDFYLQITDTPASISSDDKRERRKVLIRPTPEKLEFIKSALDPLYKYCSTEALKKAFSRMMDSYEDGPLEVVKVP